MKSVLCSLLFLFTILIGHSQIIDIPDANFKDALVNQNVVQLNGSQSYTDADTNNDGEIEIGEALAVTSMTFYLIDIESLEGIEYFINIDELILSYTEITNLDLSFLTSIEHFTCANSPLVSLDLSNLVSANTVSITYNANLVDLNLSSLN